jgi:glycerophosphoryl diester phosphodiesterase
MRLLHGILTAVLAACLVASAGSPETPLIIGHRGASGHRPEHTLESYELAIDMGADAIEPDLVMTKDGVLIARHENEIGGTTNVAEVFPSRKTTRVIDGRRVDGWFTEDFTLAEIKTLRARERLPFRSHQYDDRFFVPTFEEVLARVVKLGETAGRAIAVYPETKHPTYFRNIGLPLEDALLRALERYHLTERASPVFIQSFEASSLERMRPLTGARLVQLLDEGADTSSRRLAGIARYANGIGPNKTLVVPVGPDGRIGPPTSLVQDAHALGLFVHVWTLRADREFLSPSYDGDLANEFLQFARLAVDGFFTDFPDIAARALRP